MSAARRFWLVCDPIRMAIAPPTYRHESYESARKEAARLAALHPGSTFHVMASVGAVQKQEVQWVEFHNDPTYDDGDVPF